MFKKSLPFSNKSDKNQHVHKMDIDRLGKTERFQKITLCSCVLWNAVLTCVIFKYREISN